MIEVTPVANAPVDYLLESSNLTPAIFPFGCPRKTMPDLLNKEATACVRWPGGTFSRVTIICYTR